MVSVHSSVFGAHARVRLGNFFALVLQNIKNDSAQRNQMLIMGGVMTIFMLGFPGARPLAFCCSGVRLLLSAFCSNSSPCVTLKRVEAQAEAARIEVEPMSCDVERKAKKKRPTKKH